MVIAEPWQRAQCRPAGSLPSRAAWGRVVEPDRWNDCFSATFEAPEPDDFARMGVARPGRRALSSRNDFDASLTFNTTRHATTGVQVPPRRERRPSRSAHAVPAGGTADWLDMPAVWRRGLGTRQRRHVAVPLPHRTSALAGRHARRAWRQAPRTPIGRRSSAG